MTHPLFDILGEKLLKMAVRVPYNRVWALGQKLVNDYQSEPPKEEVAPEDLIPEDLAEIAQAIDANTISDEPLVLPTDEEPKIHPEELDGVLPTPKTL